MLKNEAVQTMSLNIKFSYLAENSKFSRSNSYFSILTPTFLRDGFLNSCFQNPSKNSAAGMSVQPSQPACMQSSQLYVCTVYCAFEVKFSFCHDLM